ncbi:MAG: hypothetical protein J1D77_05065 [Muribaculaceae bacterium]|nr:hypothetical protein [Muribaculaceae bacterium]
MKERRLTVVPTGGLANRMRAIASAYALCKATNRNLKIIWQRNGELNASFSDLFKADGLVDIVEINPILFQFYYESPRKKNLFLPQILHLFSGRHWIYFINEKNAFMTEDYFLEVAQKEIKHINVMTCYPFYDRFDQEIVNKLFQPSLKVEKRIKEILKNAVPDIAIQIRRTDHTWAIENSPTSMFEKFMEKEISNNPDITIFLATDDQEIKNLFKAKYGKNIIFNPIKASRDNTEGMIDGAAELFIMSRCKKIYGSYNSSYSFFASLFGPSELIVVKQN